MFDRQEIRDQISSAATARWNQLNKVGIKGLVPAECADIAMRVLDAAGVFAPQPNVPAEVWYFTDDEEGSSSEVYLNVDTAKAAAIADLEALDPGAVTGEEQYTWRTVEKLPNSHLLDEDGRFTGWSVNRLQIAAPVARVGAR